MLRKATEEFDRSLQAFQQAAALQSQVTGPESELVADALVEVAQVQGELQQHVLAEQTQSKVVAIYRKLFGDGSPLAVKALQSLANTQERADAYDRALASRRQILDWQRQAHGPKSAAEAEAANALGWGRLFDHRGAAASCRLFRAPCAW